MNDSILDAEEFIERKKRSERRRKLFLILKMISNGEIDSSKYPLEQIFNQLGPRQQYVSSKDRGSFNYGYLQSDEPKG